MKAQSEFPTQIQYWKSIAIVTDMIKYLQHGNIVTQHARSTLQFADILKHNSLSFKLGCVHIGNSNLKDYREIAQI